MMEACAMVHVEECMLCIPEVEATACNQLFPFISNEQESKMMPSFCSTICVSCFRGVRVSACVCNFERELADAKEDNATPVISDKWHQSRCGSGVNCVESNSMLAKHA